MSIFSKKIKLFIHGYHIQIWYMPNYSADARGSKRRLPPDAHTHRPHPSACKPVPSSADWAACAACLLSPLILCKPLHSTHGLRGRTAARATSARASRASRGQIGQQIRPHGSNRTLENPVVRGKQNNRLWNSKSVININCATWLLKKILRN